MSDAHFSTHLSADQLNLYAVRLLPPRELLAAANHVDSCDDCYRQLARVLKLDAHTVAVSLEKELLDPLSGACLSYQQKEAYVDGKASLALQTSIREHLHKCRFCEESVAGLLAMKDLLPAAQAPAVPAQSAGWRQKFHRLLLQPIWQPALIAVVLLSAAGFIWLAWSRANNPLSSIAEQSGGRQTGQVVVPADTATLTIQDAGGEVKLYADGRIEGLGALGPEAQNDLKLAMLEQRLEIPDHFAANRFDGSVLLGNEPGGKPIGKLSPVAEPVDSTRPVFRWPAVTGAVNYVVSIHDENFVKVMESAPLTNTEWRPEQALNYGGTYTWQVRVQRESDAVVLPAQTQALAEFKVITKNQAEAINRVKQEAGDSHLTLGLAYARAGLRKQARREFQQLLQLNQKASPQSRDVLKKLLRQLERK